LLGARRVAGARPLGRSVPARAPPLHGDGGDRRGRGRYRRALLSPCPPQGRRRSPAAGFGAAEGAAFRCAATGDGAAQSVLPLPLRARAQAVTAAELNAPTRPTPLGACLPPRNGRLLRERPVRFHGPAPREPATLSGTDNASCTKVCLDPSRAD